MEQKFIQIKEAAKMLGVSKLTLRNWDKSGKLTAYRHPMNNYRVYILKEVDSILRKIEQGISNPNVIKKRDLSKPKIYSLKVQHLKD